MSENKLSKANRKRFDKIRGGKDLCPHCGSDLSKSGVNFKQQTQLATPRFPSKDVVNDKDLILTKTVRSSNFACKKCKGKLSKLPLWIFRKIFGEILDAEATSVNKLLGDLKKRYEKEK